jgi:hypothetical protein
LGPALAIPDIDKNHTAQVPPGMDPTGQRHFLPDVVEPQFVAMMRAFHEKTTGAHTAYESPAFKAESRTAEKTAAG